MTAAPARTRTPTITRSCLVCGDSFTCANPHGDAARIVHNCGSYAVGPTWTLYGPVVR